MKFRDALVTLFLVFIMVYGGTVGYWLLWPYDVIVVENPITVLNTNKIVPKGDRMYYKLEWYKKLPYNGVLTRKLVNSFIFNYSDVSINAPVGHGITDASVLIPKFVPAGEYYMTWTATYQVNPIRKVSYQARSEIFLVTESEK